MLHILLLLGLLSGPATGPATAPTDAIDPSREIVIQVEGLECNLVTDVGCGHLLAPMLFEIDQIDGVQSCYSNWTGTRLRITAAPDVKPDELASRVLKRFAARQQDAKRVSDAEMMRSLREEEWRGVDRIIELSSYEFHTYAQRQVEAFARDEALDAETTRKLATIVDEIWDESGQDLDPPLPDEAMYDAYWQQRRQKLLELFSTRAREVLRPQQVEKLIQRCSAP